MPSIGGPRQPIALRDLKGAEIKPEEKVASTASYDITLATEAGGMWIPDFKLARRTVDDPGKKATIIDIPAADLAAMTTASAFKEKLTALIDENKAFLSPARLTFLETLPEGDRSNYAYINILGRRTEQFFDEASALIGRTGLTGDEAKGARQAINIAFRDAFRTRAADFDTADTGTYWSYGHDKPFVHVYEAMLAALPDGDPKRISIQNQIDFVFTHKYVDTGGVDENNAEKTIGLIAITKDTRHVVSMTKASEGSNRVSYETLELPASVGGEHAGKFAFRDGDKHFFEGTAVEVPSDLVEKLVRKPAGEIVFRRATGEKLRTNFRYDWNGNRMLNTEKINTGWWGHCDIKATLETLLADMKGSKGVTEYRSSSDKTTEFSRAMQLEALSSLINMNDAYSSTQGNNNVRFGTGQFAGGRFDDRPTTMKLKVGSGGVDLRIRLSKMSEKGDVTKNVDIAKTFATKIADEKNESFKDNPDILRVADRDTNYLNGDGRRLEGSTDGYSFDARGRPVEAKTSFVLDLDNVAADAPRVLIGTELTSIDDRRMTRTYLDPVTKEIIKVATQFVEENGEFKAKEGTETKLGKMTGIELGREMEGGDDVAGKLKMLDEAIKSGSKIATDSSTREEVWNGEVHSLAMKTEWRSDDNKWERVGVYVDATFGENKKGTLLHKLDDEGRIIDTMELSPAVDFYWKEEPRIAPLISERGNWYVNRAMSERGVISVGNNDDMMASLGALQDLSDLIYLGLKAKGGEQMFTIVHDGKRLVYADKAAWEADVKKLKGEEPEVGPDTGTVGPKKFARTPALDIPDNTPAGVSDVVTVEGLPGAVKSLTIDIDLKHTYIGDLNVVLEAPDGTSVTLHKRGGRDSDDIVGTYGADLKSFDDLNALVGKTPNGDWKLKLTDLAGRDTGSLASWSLNIESE